MVFFLSVPINCANTGPLWGGKWAIMGGKLCMFSFCVSLVLVHFPKSVKRAIGQKGWDMYIFLLRKLECTWLELF